MDKEVRSEALRQYFRYFRVWFILVAIAIVVVGIGFGVRMLQNMGKRLTVSGNDERVTKERVFDLAEVLTDEEEQSLREYIAECEARAEIDIVVVTLNEPMGLSDDQWENNMMNCADDFYDNNVFGYDKPWGDGALLLDNWYEDENGSQKGSWLSTSGKMEEIIGAYEEEKVFDAMGSSYDIASDPYGAYRGAVSKLAYYGEKGVTKTLFNISSDVGFGAAACAFVDRTGLKNILNRIGLGRLIYLVGALRVCFTAEPAEVRVTCNGRTRLYRRCLSAIVMNHCHEGGGFRFCPDADFTDGLFDICIGNGLTKPGFLRMLPNAYLGKHLRLRGIYSERAAEVTMQSSKPLWAHTDGEVLGQTTKVKMRIVPQKLRLMC